MSEGKHTFMLRTRAEMERQIRAVLPPEMSGLSPESVIDLLDEAEELNADLLEALQAIVQGLSNCHFCGAELFSERGAAHCEDCPSGCESHGAPDCPQEYELIAKARAAITATTAPPQETK